MKSYTKTEIAADFNKLAQFLAKRDINKLTTEELHNKYGIFRADMVIVLGSSILYLAELGADTFVRGVAESMMIVGGIGHSTKYLQENIRNHPEYNQIAVENRPEADILLEVVTKKTGISAESVLLENRSTNCGENAAGALAVIKEKYVRPSSIIIIQDPTMQMRTHAAFKKVWSKEKTTIISYSPFIPKIQVVDGELEIENNIYGVWHFKRFLDIVMGEIPRLRDDETGYGPNGRGFIEHVEIPEEVIAAYERLLTVYSGYRDIMLRK